MNAVVFVFYAAFVAVVSLRPASGASLEPWDKVFHLGTYAIFALLGYRVVREPREYFYLCVGIVAYGGLMEVGQSFMPGRVMSGYDFLANTLGVVLAGLVVRKVSRSGESGR